MRKPITKADDRDRSVLVEDVLPDYIPQFKLLLGYIAENLAIAHGRTIVVAVFRDVKGALKGDFRHFSCFSRFSVLRSHALRL